MSIIGRVARCALGRVGARTFSSTPVRHMQQTWIQKGVPGSTLPFSIKNHYKVTLYFFIFIALGLNSPWILIFYQIVKSAKPSE